MAQTWEEIYESWLTFEDLDVNLKRELEEMKSDSEKLEDAFYQELTFGTGGIRGILGPGTNRMNVYTVRKAAAGLAAYLLQNVVNARQRGVVIAYDARYMSKEFALEAAKVLGAFDIRAYLFQSVRPTPLLSYAVRYLTAAAGVMITASHHPPEYNGLKVYNEQGGQILLEEAEQLTEAMRETGDALRVPVGDENELEARLLLRWLGEELDRAYLEHLKQITKLDATALHREKGIQIIYTPLHGTGTDLMLQGFAQLNFSKVTIVEEQAVLDPEFPTVESANPEDPQAFALAMKYGEKLDADILLATDPDADRLGMAVRDEHGEYVVLTGNQLGSLLLDYILSHSDMNIYRNARVIKTIVTTELARAIADAYGAETIETLTGFKYIAEKISSFNASGETFMFGYEESNGYLASGFTRDKDGIQAAMLSAEMAYYWKTKGKTVLQALETLFEAHGYFLEGLHTLSFTGKAGAEQIEKIMQDIRMNPKREIAGFQVEKVEDYLAGERFEPATGKRGTIRLPKENMLKFILEDKSWVCFRPSGTEPKLNYYYGVCANSSNASKEKLQAVEAALVEWLGEIVGG